MYLFAVQYIYFFFLFAINLSHEIRAAIMIFIKILCHSGKRGLYLYVRVKTLAGDLTAMICDDFKLYFGSDFARCMCS